MGTRTFEIADLKRMGMEVYVQKYTLNLLQEIVICYETTTFRRHFIDIVFNKIVILKVMKTSLRKLPYFCFY